MRTLETRRWMSTPLTRCENRHSLTGKPSKLPWTNFFFVSWDSTSALKPYRILDVRQEPHSVSKERGYKFTDKGRPPGPTFIFTRLADVGASLYWWQVMGRGMQDLTKPGHSVKESLCPRWMAFKFDSCLWWLSKVTKESKSLRWISFSYVGWMKFLGMYNVSNWNNPCTTLSYFPCAFHWNGEFKSNSQC